MLTRSVTVATPVFIVILLKILVFCSDTLAEESHPGIDIEAQYSEAVLAFNKKQNDEALKILDDLLQKNPNAIQALELRALALKSKGDDAKSLDTYQRLIKLKPLKERGPYYFESGVILNRQKKFETAKAYFEKSLQLDFNTYVSHLYLGLMRFNDNDLVRAKIHFIQVKSSGTPELEVVGHYYLGLIYLKSGNGTIGTSEIIEARDLAVTIPESKLASDIRAGSEKILQPFSNSQWFANITTMAQYDSNVLQIPDGSSASSLGSGKSTPKLNLIGGIGRMTAPLNTIQWVPSYRFSFNRNFSSDARSYEFFTNTLSFFFNYRPLARASGGLKLDGNFTFQNQAENPLDGNSSYKFYKYSSTFEAGPFFRYQFAQGARADWEINFRPQKYYLNDDLSGSVFMTRLSAKASSSSNYWNPSGSLSFEDNQTKSSEYIYKSFGLGVSDIMRLPGANQVTLSLDYQKIDYSHASTVRNDKTLTARASWMKSLSSRLTLLGDVSFTKNNSNIPSSYTYSRAMTSFGVSYAL